MTGGSFGRTGVETFATFGAALVSGAGDARSGSAGTCESTWRAVVAGSGGRTRTATGRGAVKGAVVRRRVNSMASPESTHTIAAIPTAFVTMEWRWRTVSSSERRDGNQVGSVPSPVI